MDQSPVEGSHPDPFGNALTVGGQKVAELAAVAALAGQVAGQARAGKQAAAAETAETDLARARTVWAPILDGGWRADASLLDVTWTWAAAVPWEHDDPGAAQAVNAAEQRLRELHPSAMAGYDQRRETLSRAEAMLETVSDFALHPSAARQGHAAPGLTDAEANTLRRVLGPLARLTARSAAAGRAPLTPQIAEAVLRDDVPPEVAARVAEGLSAGYSALPAQAAPAPAQPTVSDYGPGAASWPSSVHQAVGAAALQKAAGGRRPTARRAGTMPTRAPRAHPAP